MAEAQGSRRRQAVARVDDMEPDSMRRVELDGVEVLLARADDGGFYAIQDTCTHEEFSLSEGEIWGFEVECPAHGSRFDLRTGKVRNLPAVIPARTYLVSIESGQVIVDLDRESGY